jgi:aspartate/methionine/tyrosine aminotransferase
MSGLIATRARHYPFEGGFETLAAGRRLEAAGRRLVHLDYGEPDFETPPHIVEAAVRALRGGHTHYTAPAGIPDLRAAIADEVLRSRGVEVAPEQVVVTAGSSQGLLLAILALVEPGSSAILTDPGYPLYPALVQTAGGRAVTVPVRGELGFRPDPEELSASMDETTRVLVINSPHNPTGSFLRRSDLEAVAEIAIEHDLLVCSDEVYRDLTYGDEPAPSILSVPGMAERTICLDSFSKRYAMCGWRLGFVVAPPAVARRLEAMMFMSAICPPGFVQVAGLEALRSTDSAAATARMRGVFAERRQAVWQGLDRLPGVTCHLPEAGFFAFPDIRGTGLTDAALTDRLLQEQGVAVLPGSMFGPAGAGNLRISYAASMEDIEAGIQGLERALCQGGEAR